MEQKSLTATYWECDRCGRRFRSAKNIVHEDLSTYYYCNDCISTATAKPASKETKAPENGTAVWIVDTPDYSFLALGNTGYGLCAGITEGTASLSLQLEGGKYATFLKNTFPDIAAAKKHAETYAKGLGFRIITKEPAPHFGVDRFKEFKD